VIMREIRTLPGDLYNRSKIIRTQRELATLGYFDPEKLNVNPTPDPSTGTVDLQYVVAEKLSDQIEASVGWGAQMFVGTLGLSLNNFSLRNMFKKDGWKPLPSGDGQRLSIRAQSNGYYYQGYSLSFVEPWLGGKKPNSLTVSVYHSIYSNGLFNVSAENKQYMKITGASVGLGRRLKVPDDYFTLYNELNYQVYNLHNYTYYNLFSYNNGVSNNFSLNTVFGRNSVDQPICGLGRIERDLGMWSIRCVVRSRLLGWLGLFTVRSRWLSDQFAVRVTCHGAETFPFQILCRNRFTVQFMQLRFVIKKIDMGWCPVLEKINYPLRLRREAQRTLNNLIALIAKTLRRQQ